jgi:hypothetical protein
MYGMNWRNKWLKIAFVAFGLALFSIAVYASLAFWGLRLYEKITQEQKCSIYGCIGGVTVELDGLLDAAPYEVVFTYPSGETKVLSCSGIEGDSQHYPEICRSQSAFISLPAGEPPKEIIATIKTNNGQWIKAFQPDYRGSNPNGDDCPVMCYSATIVFDNVK